MAQDWFGKCPGAGPGDFYSHGFSQLVKGAPRVLVRDGRVDREQIARSKFTEDDLEENLRLNGSVKTPAEVAEARWERDGTVSVVKKGKPGWGLDSEADEISDEEESEDEK